MFRQDALESVPIVNTVLNALLAWTATRGREGADLRAAVGDVKGRGLIYLQTDSIGPHLVECFDLAVAAGITLPQMLQVRTVAASQHAFLVGAIMVRDAMIELALASSGEIIAGMVFKSRQLVDQTRDAINLAFEAIEETVADDMDSMTYRSLISLHAAIIAHMTETARPLPRMLTFQFGFAQPTLVMAYKLYADAGRANELRAENKVVHPAFTRPRGRALSA